MRQNIVIGSGGHALVVVDSLLVSGEAVIGVLDADPSSFGKLVCGVPVIGDDDALSRFDPERTTLINGIGGVGSASTHGLRQRVQERLEGLGWSFGSVRHPSAIVSPRAEVSDGVHVLAGAVVQAGARLGTGVIINTAAVVEHDVEVGAWSHVAPGAVLCGAVIVGANSHVGAAAVVKQSVRLGSDTVIGAGAVVVRDFRGSGVLVGVPARPLNGAI